MYLNNYVREQFQLEEKIVKKEHLLQEIPFASQGAWSERTGEERTVSSQCMQHKEHRSLTSSR